MKRLTVKKVILILVVAFFAFLSINLGVQYAKLNHMTTLDTGVTEVLDEPPLRGKMNMLLLGVDEGGHRSDTMMVVSVDNVKNEIKQIADLAHRRGAIVKVILETCYLTDEQKVAACKLSEEAGADFVKTSTGYGSKGCTIDDLKLMRASVSAHVRVKGSGGIRDLDTVLSARAVGASRCGVSATAKIMEEAEARYVAGTLKEVEVIKEMEGGY